MAGDRLYQASDFAEFFNSLVTNGVFPSPTTNLQVLSNSNMTVTLKAGPAWIKGYHYTNDSDLILPITVADGVLNRIDRIVIKLDTVARNITAVVKKGVFASSPVAPTLQRDADSYELGIADVYVGAGVVSVTQANITDQRMNTALCGWVNSLIQVDTTAIFNQYQAWFTAQSGAYNTQMTTTEAQFTTDWNTWFNAMKGQLTTDAAGNLQTQINTHIADDIKHVGYALATNVGNAYSVNIPNLTALTDGLQIRTKFNIASTGAITINPNALGAKAVVDYFGNAVTNVRLNLIANLAYDSTSGNFILQGKGGGGNALAADVYTGITATADTGPIIGTNKYKIGAIIKDTDMLLQAGGQGTQVWVWPDITHARDIAVDSAGNVYVAYYGGSVRKFNSAGVQQWVISDVSNAIGIAVDSVGNVYVAYSNAAGTTTVRKLNSAGVQVWALSDISSGQGIAVDSAGNVYVVYMGTVRKLNSAGVQQWALSDISSAVDIAVDSVGNVYVVYTNTSGTTVRKLNPAGVQVWANADMPYAKGIAVDSVDNVYVAYSLNDTYPAVRKLDSLGRQVWTKVDTLYANNIAVDVFGNAYVAYDSVSVGQTSVKKLDGASYYTINT